MSVALPGAVYLLKQVAAICILHHNAETAALFLEEGFLIRNYVWVLDRCEDSDLVE